MGRSNKAPTETEAQKSTITNLLDNIHSKIIINSRTIECDGVSNNPCVELRLAQHSMSIFRYIH